MSTWSKNLEKFRVAKYDELQAEIEKLRAALDEILSLQPLKTQHEHHIAMLKTLDTIRKALAKEAK